ncbi:MAG: bifunctional riboflavin kinase/FAD synthetase [Anaeromicrobium sp.]|jgi:riboflavin kinase/FMN adenylyltransferase|uniref:bifunctional riboflavin kinase/FAD synthetase n=1 Tax=Anaeromicrobium sp. TaxID=1929132 RepID=UPI0025EFE55F|nr:bifunctional riboflavin kinase/FAD synthetase [Anaeromicrobium sp.]MCT4595632.1 bifunctional riboflavin kinase/FAD synthetase [Anaeromicrobium sp.]
MKVIRKLSDVNISEDTGVALGNFDGVHIGHQTLLVNLVETCRLRNLKSVVYTFSNHPRAFTSEDGAPKRIMNLNKKLSTLSELGIDYVVLVPFDEFQMKLKAESFIRDILKNTLKMKSCIVGFNYKFGYKAQGDTHLLRELSKEYDYELNEIDSIEIQRQIVSSTNIRNLISDGNIQRANLFLGKKYSINGQVVEGKKVGRKIGVPTANIKLEKNMLTPSSGVYLTKVSIDGKLYDSITNVGYNPTFSQGEINIETHVMNFRENIYGKNIEVHFIDKIREEKKFPSVEDLTIQLKKDIDLAKNFFKKRQFTIW